METTIRVHIQTGGEVTYSLHNMKPGQHMSFQHAPEQIVRFDPPAPNERFGIVKSRYPNGEIITAVYCLA